jgi:hypothetical protein
MDETQKIVCNRCKKYKNSDDFNYINKDNIEFQKNCRLCLLKYKLRYRKQQIHNYNIKHNLI